ncbi:MAG: cytidylate kinase-like family protein [Spirochaetaceae bacterium]|nr:cytidylate kinase-like family protein [Spirochaetaceae bacterium]MBQ4554543.1 cytidylate kinase-like family protein [Spirochaetaceae bacterium]MBQ4555360.1 cytidylate kinase-like family protein [Spirochaetaceae bacterium]MBR4011779.1 cytidylate kinase-like family protein [Spirochaetaceae bacterium]
MAIITISRQVAALGDEVAAALAKKLGYKFIDRKYIENRIVELGFPEEKMKKYDERKPGFFASLVKDRDEYLDYLQTAILETAKDGNCVLIGRGAFVVLENVPNLIAVRFVAKDEIREERLMKEFDWNKKQAQGRITESDENRKGFHKNFFNIEPDNPANYHLTLNTGILTVDESANAIANLCKALITEEKEIAGEKKVQELYQAQLVVNALLFEHKVNVNFLRAVIDGEKLILQGVADSVAISEKAASLAREIMPDKTVESCISIVQDFNTYP